MSAAGVAAIEYIDRGWPVCPWRQRGNKKFPLTKHGHKDATTNAAVVTAWWRRYPDAIPAIRLGADVGVVGLDYDPDEFEPGAPDPFATWPVTPCCSSPSG